MAPEENEPGTAVTEAPVVRSRAVKSGYLQVSELAADRAAAPSPFGDDQTFPLPVEDLTYTPTTGS